MKRLLIALLLLVACWLGLVLPCLADDIKDHPTCKYCGMNRETFAHSRMLIIYQDGSVTPLCSLHCAALDLALTIDRSIVSITVGDYGTKREINADRAFWVVGGNKPGVMTRNAKWAFEKEDDALRFVKENGGKKVTFDEALQLAYTDMANDVKMIRERRKMQKMKMPEEKQHQH